MHMVVAIGNPLLNTWVGQVMS